MYVMLSFQQTATSTSCRACGRSVGTPTRAWCTTYGSESAALSSLGVQRPWRRPSYQFSRKVCHCRKRLANMTYPTRPLFCTPTESITCWGPQPMVAQVSHLTRLKTIINLIYQWLKRYIVHMWKKGTKSDVVCMTNSLAKNDHLLCILINLKYI